MKTKKEFDDDALAGCLAGCGVLTLALAALVLGIIAHAIALSYVWEWFIVPLGVVGIGIPHAVGVASVGKLVTAPGRIEVSAKGGKKTYKRVLDAMSAPFIRPAVILLVAYIASLFMDA